MARTVSTVLLGVLLVPASALAGGPRDVDSVMRYYEASGVAREHIRVSMAGNLVYVSGTADGAPWLDVWRRTAGEWKIVAEAGFTEIAPIRFGAKPRQRSCRTS